MHIQTGSQQAAGEPQSDLGTNQLTGRSASAHAHSQGQPARADDPFGRGTRSRAADQASRPDRRVGARSP
jgi:hypothetical protein